MNSQNSKSPERRRSSNKAEYRVFFFIVFLMALPFAMFSWFRDLVRGNFAELQRGVIGRALTEAKATTPMIFSA